MALVSKGNTAPTYYTILNLPNPPVPLRKSELRAAYRRALLKHHPDKSVTSSSTSTGAGARGSTSYAAAATCPTGKGSWAQTYTIDQVTTAYKTLADPVARAEYDRALRLEGPGRIVGSLNWSGDNGDEDDAMFRTGLQELDLDDMEIEICSDLDHEGSRIWYHSCRCGSEKGFLIREEDMEREVERGEVVVGCVGCSLWARVLFAVDDGGEELEGETKR